MPPAARVGDMHTCPMVTGIVPHVGGPVLPPGCPTVLIGNMPAARVGDMAVCVGPPDTIAKGSATVLIGNMPAARLGDSTAHGGVIVVGCPTVMIGDSGGGSGGGGGAQAGAVAQGAASAGADSQSSGKKEAQISETAAVQGGAAGTSGIVSKRSVGVSSSWDTGENGSSDTPDKDAPSDTPSETTLCNLISATLSDVTSKRTVKAVSSQPVECHVKLPTAKRAAAGQYNMVLEVVSYVQLSNKGMSKEKTAQIQAKLEAAGGCPTHQSVLAVVTPLNSDRLDAVVKETTLPVGTEALLTPAKYWPPVDDPQGVFLFSEFFMSPEKLVKELSFQFERCGVCETGTPLARLSGLVRVYRDEQFELTVKLPPWKTKNYFKREPEEEGASKDSSTDWNGRGSSVTIDADKHIQETSSTQKQGWVFKSEDKKTHDWEHDEVEESHEEKIDLTFTFSRNGVELETLTLVTQIVQNLRQTAEKFTEALLDLEESLPKLGVSYSVNVSFLVGTLTGTWGVRPQRAWDTPSGLWVDHYGELTLGLEIMKAEASIQFGVEASSPAILNWWGGKTFELIALVKASVTTALALKGTFAIWGPGGEEDGERTIATSSCNTDAEVYAHGKVSALGFTLEAQAGLETGLDCEAALVIPLDIKVDATLRKGVVYAFWRAPGKQRPSPRWEHTLWEKREWIKDRRLLSGKSETTPQGEA